ncbi:ribulokinase [Sphingobacterium spiritivorum]|uniref:ribulokinase n=1 Tax=Sphingobacterium spiritivorum TaxID=258 RepID=UPI003DA26435
MKPKQYVIGVDFGSDSVRSIIVDALTGAEVSSAIHFYSRWQEGLYCDASRNQFRQHPLDYIEGITATIKSCITKAGGKNIAASVRGIAVDTTGSTPVAVDRSGTPLALCSRFENNPNAMFVLWKDHTAVREAAEINTHAQKFDIDYLKYVGSIYSSEWFWAKLLHILRVDEKIRSACYSWVEHCDWIPFLLTGGTDITQMKRSRCAAGHKALWAEEFEGLPPDTFFSSLDPLLTGFSSRLFTETYTSDIPAGHLCPEWAERLGLSTSVVVSVGAFDAHMGAVGGQIEPYHLSKVMGTSTCDILVVPGDDIKNTLIKGICGQVNGSVIPGMVGLEAGQSAFGDLYAWFKQILAWPLKHLLSKSTVIDAASAKALESEMLDLIIPELSRQASVLPLSGDDELAIDWLNGRRTPDASQELKGALSQLDLGTDAPRIFKALVEASCFGARNIIERFIAEGIPVKGIIGLGGVAKKSPYIMQMMADVLQMPIRIHRSEHTCALGAAMFAAVAAGIYRCIEDAMQAIGNGFDSVYYPDPERSSYFDIRFLQYKSLGHHIEFNIIYE